MSRPVIVLLAVTYGNTFFTGIDWINTGSILSCVIAAVNFVTFFLVLMMELCEKA